MRDFRAAIVPVLAIEGLQMARFADSLRGRAPRPPPVKIK